MGSVESWNEYFSRLVISTIYGIYTRESNRRLLSVWVVDRTAILASVLIYDQAAFSRVPVKVVRTLVSFLLLLKMTADTGEHAVIRGFTAKNYSVAVLPTTHTVRKLWILSDSSHVCRTITFNTETISKHLDKH